LISLILIVLANFFTSNGSSKLSAYIGLGWLVLTLVPPLLFRVKFIPFNQFWKLLQNKKRDFGITAGLNLVLHSVFSWWQFSKFSLSFLGRGYILIGVVAILIIVALLATSSSWSVKVLQKNWQRLHSLVWLVVPLAQFHAIQTVANLNNELEISVLALVTIPYLAVVIYAFSKKIWHQLILLVIGFVIAITISTVTNSWPVLDNIGKPDADYSAKQTNPSTSSQPTSSTASSQRSESESSSSAANDPNLANITNRKINQTELAQANSRSKCWLSFDKKVYDTTNYMSSHPGGEKEILKFCGKAIDSRSKTHPGGQFDSAKIQSILQGMYVGDLE
jgi:sulfoxide reductase heme-binding subunit YedZ